MCEPELKESAVAVIDLLKTNKLLTKSLSALDLLFLTQLLALAEQDCKYY